MDTKLDSGVEAATGRGCRQWALSALELIRAEATRSAATPLIPFALPAFAGVDLYLKDESAHPTGSLKHRLARSLFVHALCSGELGPGMPVIEASSGSTAVSEAYFARIVGLPFVAVLPRATSREKIELIESFGGECLRVDPADVVAEARALALRTGGYFMDQFTFAAQATNWRTENIAEEIFDQMAEERFPRPEWVVVGAGTGGTSTTIARYTRYKGLPTQVAVVDPEGSAFYDGWRLNDTSITTSTPSRIEGIGRTQVEPSFYPNLVDEVLRVPDAASIAAMRWTSLKLGRRVGPSTGTNVWGAIQIAQRMDAAEEPGSIVSLICDVGWRYSSTYFDDGWLDAQGIDITAHLDALHRFEKSGRLLVG